MSSRLVRNHGRFRCFFDRSTLGWGYSVSERNGPSRYSVCSVGYFATLRSAKRECKRHVRGLP